MSGTVKLPKVLRSMSTEEIQGIMKMKCADRTAQETKIYFSQLRYERQLKAQEERFNKAAEIASQALANMTPAEETVATTETVEAPAEPIAAEM